MDEHAAFFQGVSRFSGDDHKRIERAMKLAEKAHEGQKRGDGSAYFTHPYAVAEILRSWGADADTIIAGLLHDAVEDTECTLEFIEQEFGKDVAELVEGVTKFTEADFEGKDSYDDEVETLRRLFEVMRKDIRVIIIKFADRLHNLRTIAGLSEERRITFAKESLDVYYKIAFHLGMNEFCREITNICVPYVYPEKATIRERHRIEQGPIVKNAVTQMEKELGDIDVDKVIRKIQLVESSHDVPRPQNEDEAADRAYYCTIITKDVDSCYSVFKMLHRLYRPVRRRFHDYIASPAESGYRSLHTTVIGPHDKPLQIRIRTGEMDDQVHWGVLRTAFSDKAEDLQEFSWLHRSAELDRTTRENSEAFWKALQSDIFQKSMQVTANGEGLSVPIGASALDAAYFLLGNDAHTLEQVTINGKKEEFSTPLHEDDVVELIVNGVPHVSIDWLQGVTTKFARNQIVEALKERARGEKFLLGQQLLQKELDHFQKILVGEISKAKQESIAEHFKRPSFEDVIVMIGEGVIVPQEVVLFMQKERKRRFRSLTKTFRLQLIVPAKFRDEVITQVSALARLHEITFENISVKEKQGTGSLGLLIRGRSVDRSHYADFLSALERHSWISSMHTLISLRQKIILLTSICVAFLLIAVDFALLARWSDLLSQLHFLPVLGLQMLLLLPVLIANYYLLQTLRHYIVWLRNDRWFLVLGLSLNLVSCSIIFLQGVITGALTTLLPLLAVIIFFMFYIVYRFVTTEELFAKATLDALKPLTDEEWKQIRRKKMVGYTFRLGAVIIWGLQPLYIKYTPANEVDPFVRVFLTGIGVLLITFFFLLIKRLRGGIPIRQKLRIPKNVLLLNIIIGYILFSYFINASLQFTTSTNFILFNNFSPVLALLVGALLWRSSMPYLKDPQKMLWIFLVFLMGSTGSALIIFNSLSSSGSTFVYGDMLGLLAMGADTLLVVSQIRYLKLFQNVSSLAINVYVFLFHILSMLPVLVWYYFAGSPQLFSLGLTPALFGIGAGVLASFGQILNYETFRRIDGFIAFLMFNVSILVTFIVEVFFLGEFSPSWTLLIGGVTVIASTIIAEMINSQSQKKGL